jgi:hypothetical protein
MSDDSTEPHSGGGASPSPLERYAAARFELLGLDADATMMGIIAVADSLYEPSIDALIKADLGEVGPEPGVDLSRAPRSIEER